MDTGSMTFEEILFNGRYHIIGGLIFLVFIAAFARELVRELLALRSSRNQPARTLTVGPLYHDAMLGHTMTDGGEPVEQDEAVGEEEEKD